MRKLDKGIEKLNFKKIVTLYLIVAVLAGIFSVVFLGYMYKDKLVFAYNYSIVSEKIENGKLGVDAVKEDITNLANQSGDIVDILILDKNNEVSFSAKNSKFASDGKFSLERGKDDAEPYLTYCQDQNVTFKLIKNNELMLSTVLFDYEKDIKNDHNDNTFYENDFKSKKVYLLSYTADKGTGDKIYFISDVCPVANGSLYLKIVGALATLFFMLYWVLLAIWVYQNAKKSKLNSVLWGVIVLFTNLAGLFIFFIYKQNNQTCFKCGAVQNKGNIYCTNCGTKISKTCSRCSTTVNSTDRFCNHCGDSISNSKKSEE
ncbi:MAG: zinc ribbon domain-containing protein [Eubacteriales bacterium]